MKKISSLLAFLIIGSFVYAQSVNDVPLSEIDAKYIRIVGTSKAFSTKVVINIEFGQHVKIFKAKSAQLRDENNKPITLNSMVDAMNLMDKYGYEFTQAYAFNVGNQNVYHYLMKKRDSIDGESTEQKD
jgi:hypothetical protein